MSWWYNFWHKPTPTPTPVPTPTPSPVNIPAKIYGVATDTFAEVAQFNALAGKPVNVYSIYKSFYWDAVFPTAEVKGIAAAGYTPMITLEPWEPNGNAIQPLYALSTINAGKYDSIIRSWASAIKALGFPVLLRFAHEMNGDWYPWGAGVNGNLSPLGYINAYKHVRTLFVAAGVTNVAWVWSPNVDFPTKPFYPGDSYVDWIAVDGYNFGGRSPDDVFQATLNEIRTYTNKPIFIGETGTFEDRSQPKGPWITAFFAMLKAHSLNGFVWFETNKEQNWRIDSSPAAIAAFKNGVSTL